MCYILTLITLAQYYNRLQKWPINKLYTLSPNCIKWMVFNSNYYLPYQKAVLPLQWTRTVNVQSNTISMCVCVRSKCFLFLLRCDQIFSLWIINFTYNFISFGCVSIRAIYSILNQAFENFEHFVFQFINWGSEIVIGGHHSKSKPKYLNFDIFIVRIRDIRMQVLMYEYSSNDWDNE